MIAEFTVIPLDKGAHLSKWVAPMLEIVSTSGVDYQFTAMGTVLEAPDLASIFRAVEMAHDAVREAGGERIYFVLKVDARYDTDASARKKLESIGEEL